MPKMLQVMFSEESRGWFLLTQNSVFSEKDISPY